MEFCKAVISKDDFEVSYDGNGCAIVKHEPSDSVVACGRHKSKEMNLQEAILSLAYNVSYRKWIFKKLM